jgi:exopolysaccharide biosynthesis polyprenyl glycosylphosphotransferase
VLGRTCEIVQVAGRHEVDKVIIALPIRAFDKISRLIDRCESAGIEAEVVPDLFRFAKPYTGLKSLEGLPLLSVTSLPIKSWAYAVLKRCFDITLSFLLLVTTAPLMALLALLIKLSSWGPVFFTQERIGMNGKRFKIIKFRTMLPNAEEVLKRRLAEDEALRDEWYTNFKLKRDPRITRIGLFLRRTSLDELPQLINVLRGEMSLVGPRPLPGYHQLELSPRVRALRGRVLPGMTGLWQISGRSEAGTEGMEVWDMYYVQNWSVWLDFVTLVKTLPVVLKGTGAL